MHLGQVIVTQLFIDSDNHVQDDLHRRELKHDVIFRLTPDTPNQSTDQSGVDPSHRTYLKNLFHLSKYQKVLFICSNYCDISLQCQLFLRYLPASPWRESTEGISPQP